ncbi:Holliday junction resolvase RuvX [Synechococcus sp. PCC 7336]|uniref:Holliday junction resolvase RuvX n=1 Tax=Synechococcus sp. PCC 7336 TaxID=195250 RepID=UPI000367E6BF|nr:Holliday junction resolvase RuvX [Synechococcus sp. PCC 7336]
MRERISVLALDVGDRRIGVAGCDGTGSFATGLTTIHRQNVQADIATLQQWVERRQAQRFVVGLPFNMNGSVGFQARKVKRFMKSVTAQIPLPVEYVDERLSSVQARWNLQAAGISVKGKRELVDRAAATVILQQWIERRRFELEREQRQGKGD